MAELRIGTCSWKYDSWKGLVYSEKPSINYLEEYSGHFNTVEIDQWFWSLFKSDSVKLPQSHIVKEYVESVPNDFKFTIKIPNSITLTHFYKKQKSDPLVPNPHFLSVKLFEKFLKSLEPMGEKLGPLMFQFEYLNKQKMPSQKEFLDKFGEFISSCSKDYSYCLEVRNPQYLNKPYFSFINEFNLYHVFVQGYYMPSIFQSYLKFAEHIRNLTVIRLLGPDRQGIEKTTAKKWDKIVAPKDEELTHLSQMIDGLLAKDVDVYVNVNNHYEGSAPITIKKINENFNKDN
ncbi:DUF72 domain-containing protein [bacterium]|nr:DUF72 domain-containing protein [bacterium]